MEAFYSLDGWISLMTLTLLEIVLGIDVDLASLTESISDFISKHESLQILSLSFLILIGTVLVAESAHVEIPKPFIYCSVGFALTVQLLTIRASRRR